MRVFSANYLILLYKNKNLQLLKRQLRGSIYNYDVIGQFDGYKITPLEMTTYSLYDLYQLVVSPSADTIYGGKGLYTIKELDSIEQYIEEHFLELL